MARRYCGRTRIYVNYYDSKVAYQCRVVTPSGRRIFWVGLPRIITVAVDHPMSIDDVARAAISFAIDEDERGVGDIDIGVSDYIYYTEDGEYEIKRRSQLTN